MKKKGLSLLLALSMVFTMNAVAFAGETTDAVQEQYDQTYGEYSQSYNETTQSVDEYTKSLNGTTLNLTVANAVVSYTGSKITAADLGIRLTDSETGYSIPVKKIKLTGSNKKATATGAITYKMTGIYNWKYVGGTNGQKNTMKAAYKTLKTKFKTAKSVELKAYVAPHYIEDSVSLDLIKSLKKNKTLSGADLNVDGSYLGDCVIVTTKNSAVKKVQLVVPQWKWIKADGATVGYTLKLKLKKLKKGTDYTVSGDVINFKDSASFSGSGSFKAK